MEGGECLKIQLLPRDTFKFSAHDGLSPTLPEPQSPQAGSALPGPTLNPAPRPAPSPAGPRAPCPSRSSAYLCWNRMSAAAGSPPLERRQAGRSEGHPKLAFSGQRIPYGPPRKTGCVRGRGSGPERWEGAARGLRTDRTAQNGSTTSKQYRSLTREGWRGSGPAIRRSGDTKEPWRNFQPEPAAERGDGAEGPSVRAPLSSPAGASARPRFAAPSGAEAGAISKSFQEVSGPPHPASRPPAALGAAAPAPRAPSRRAPGRPGAAFVCGCRAPGSPGGVEPQAARAARGGRTGSCC